MNKIEIIYVACIVIIIGFLMFLLGFSFEFDTGYNIGYETSKNYCWTVLSEIAKNETEFKIENYRWIKIDAASKNIFIHNIFVPGMSMEVDFITPPCIMKNSTNTFYNCYTENNKTYLILTSKINRTG